VTWQVPCAVRQAPKRGPAACVCLRDALQLMAHSLHLSQAVPHPAQAVSPVHILQACRLENFKHQHRSASWHLAALSPRHSPHSRPARLKEPPLYQGDLQQLPQRLIQFCCAVGAVCLLLVLGLLPRASPSRREVASFETLLYSTLGLLLKSMLSGILKLWCVAPT
jgi:hypothetical protein